MDNLKPCPFCGSKDLAIESFGELRHCVVCETCECSTGYMRDDYEAIESWNTRPIEDELLEAPELLAALENICDLPEALICPSVKAFARAAIAKAKGES